MVPDLAGNWARRRRTPAQMREAILAARRASSPPEDTKALAAALKVSYRNKMFLAVLDELEAENQGRAPS